MKLVSSAQMRSIDSRAINEFGIPGIDLMESAGRGIAKWIREIFEGEVSGKRFAVFCGKGNNGGDGYVIARYLFSWSARPEVFLLAKPDELKGDALKNLQRIQALEIPILRLDKDDKTWIPASAGMTGGAKGMTAHGTGVTEGGAGATRTEAAVKSDTVNLARFDMIIDAIFGTGFSGKVDATTTSIIKQINASGVAVLSVDTPSGLSIDLDPAPADTSEMSDSCIHASYTATLALPKIGHYFFPTRAYCGHLEVIDIGIPPEAINAEGIHTHLISPTMVQELIPARPPTAHKGDCGKLFIVAGSVGLTGAAVLAAEAAIKAGAGQVKVGTPSSLNDILEVKLTEAMTRPLPELRKPRCLALRSLGVILEEMRWADALCIGPGINRHHETMDLVRRLIGKLDRPAVLDADGLFAFSGTPELLRSCEAPLVLTPHAFEFARLTGQELAFIETNRIDSLRDYSERIDKVVLLKGAPTLIAAPNGEIYLSETGNPGMATGGSGDVLTGVIGALLAYGLEPLAAASAGAYLHGVAGDIAAMESGTFGLIAGDIVSALPDAFIEVLA